MAKKLVLKKDPATETVEAPKKKLVIKKKPVTMDMFIVEKDIDSDDSDNVSLAVVKKKLIRKVVTKDE
jgi:hypothetical protein